MLRLPWSSRTSWLQLSIEEIRKRSRLLVVDDGEFFYLALFKKDGYNIEKWDEVNDLPKLESGYYDIILLDIQDVGKKLSKEQGLGVLRHLKKVCPAQIVVAYSNADFSLKYKDFFDMADKVLAKQDDYVDFKRAVDTLLGHRFSLGFYLDSVAKLASPHLPETTKIRKAAEKAIRARNPRRLENVLRRAEVPPDPLDAILRVVALAIKISTAIPS